MLPNLSANATPLPKSSMPSGSPPEVGIAHSTKPSVATPTTLVTVGISTIVVRTKVVCVGTTELVMGFTTVTVGTTTLLLLGADVFSFPIVQ